MKKIFTIIIGLLLNNFFLAAQNYSFTPAHSTVIDSSKGKVMLHQCSRSYPRTVTSFWIVSKSEIKILEKNFKKLLELRSSGCCYPGTKISDLSKYIFQYVGVIIDGKKYIYINSSTGWINQKSWEETPYVACDGGPNFWGVLFSLDELQFSQLAFNGDA